MLCGSLAIKLMNRLTRTQDEHVHIDAHWCVTCTHMMNALSSIKAVNWGIQDVMWSVAKTPQTHQTPKYQYDIDAWLSSLRVMSSCNGPIFGSFFLKNLIKIWGVKLPARVQHVDQLSEVRWFGYTLGENLYQCMLVHPHPFFSLSSSSLSWVGLELKEGKME